MSNLDLDSHRWAEKRFMSHVERLLDDERLKIDTLRGRVSVSPSPRKFVASTQWNDRAVELKRLMIELSHGRKVSLVVDTAKVKPLGERRAVQIIPEFRQFDETHILVSNPRSEIANHRPRISIPGSVNSIRISGSGFSASTRAFIAVKCRRYRKFLLLRRQSAAVALLHHLHDVFLALTLKVGGVAQRTFHNLSAGGEFEVGV